MNFRLSKFSIVEKKLIVELCKTDFMEVASDLMRSAEKWAHRAENDQFRLLNILFLHPINGKSPR